MRIAFYGDSLTSGMPGSAYFDKLQDRFPNDRLFNFGKVNDTIVSLNKRISNLSIDESFELAFLWIGVNDVTLTHGWLRRMINALLGQRPARNDDEFRAYYRATLSLLCENAERVIAVAPLLKSENLGHDVNLRLADLAELIKNIALDNDRVVFLDLRSKFTQVLEGKPLSHYKSRNPLRVLLDLLTLRSDEQIDRRAVKRGYQLTLDGVHLNSSGAELVAEVFAGWIDSYRGGRLEV